MGIPNVVGADSSLGVNVSVQQRTNKSWTYGTSDSKTVTKTRTGQIPIQPGETVKPVSYTHLIVCTVAFYFGTGTVAVCDFTNYFQFTCVVVELSLNICKAVDVYKRQALLSASSSKAVSFCLLNRNIMPALVIS